MRRTGCNGQEEGLGSGYCIVEKPKGLFGQDVCQILALVTDWRILVSLESRIEILVGKGIQKDIGLCESSGKR